DAGFALDADVQVERGGPLDQPEELPHGRGGAHQRTETRLPLVGAAGGNALETAGGRRHATFYPQPGEDRAADEAFERQLAEDLFEIIGPGDGTPKDQAGKAGVYLPHDFQKGAELTDGVLQPVAPFVDVLELAGCAHREHEGVQAGTGEAGGGDQV